MTFVPTTEDLAALSADGSDSPGGVDIAAGLLDSSGSAGDPSTDPYADLPSPASLAAEPEGQGGEDGGMPLLSARLLSREGLRDLPDPEPLITDVLDKGTTALLYGPWGCGKSFIALDWAASVAAGRSWQGRTTEPGRVLYVAGEGAFGLKGRVDAWERGWSKSLPDAGLDVLPEPVNIWKPGALANLSALVSWGGYELVVLDTLARCMVGADENSARDSGIVVDALTRLREATPDSRGVVVGVHHTGKDGRTLRGSSAFEGGAETVYQATRDGGAIDLLCTKRKDGPEGDHHRLRIAPVEGTDSAVVECLTGGGTFADRDDRARLIVRSTLAGTTIAGGELIKLLVGEGMNRSTAYRARADLEKDGTLTNLGTEKRPVYRVLS